MVCAGGASGIVLAFGIEGIIPRYMSRAGRWAYRAIGASAGAFISISYELKGKPLLL